MYFIRSNGGKTVAVTNHHLGASLSDKEDQQQCVIGLPGLSIKHAYNKLYTVTSMCGSPFSQNREKHL